MTTENSYQNHYQSQIGFAELNKKTAIAGKSSNFTLKYTVGNHGIDETGAIKVLFRIASDIGIIQFTDSKDANYVKASSSNKNVRFNFSGTSTGDKGKQYVRPWSQGFTIHIIGSHLKKGEFVTIHFKKLRMQTYCEKNFQFRIAVDPFAVGRFVFLKKSPSILILPAKPKSLQIISPSTIIPNNEFSVFVKAEDEYGNFCSNFSSKIFLFSDNENVSLSKKNMLKNGYVKVKAKISQEGLYFIKAKMASITAVSNPIKCSKSIKNNYFWADLHGQTQETVGTNTIDDYYKFAKKVACLNVTCHQGNDFQITKKLWKIINQTSKKYNEDNKFIALPGYEWSGNSSVGGDHNIIYSQENLPIHRSSHALLDDFSDIQTDVMTVKKLFKKIDPTKTFTIAHVGGRYADISKHAKDSSLDAIEIHSDWGTFEWILQDAFKKGLRIGIVANSDGHKGTPGASYPGLSHFGSQGGLTCIRAKTLTRKDIFSALKNHHTYATTGTRILLDVICKKNSKIIGISGDKIETKEATEICIETVGTAPLERVELHRRNKIVKTFFPEYKKNNSKYIKILWSGAKSKGRSRKYKWSGNLSISKNSLGRIEKIHFYNNSDFLFSKKSELYFSGTTTGGVQGFIIEVKNNNEKLFLTVNGKKITISTKDVTQKPKKYFFDGLETKLEIYETTISKEKIKVNNFKYILKTIPVKTEPYFVKVVQRDGHMAWSSPLYISFKK